MDVEDVEDEEHVSSPKPAEQAPPKVESDPESELGTKEFFSFFILLIDYFR
jgi:hypothetical protein